MPARQPEHVVGAGVATAEVRCRARERRRRDVLYGVYCGGRKPGIRSVRLGDWKLIKYESPAGGLLAEMQRHDDPFRFSDQPRKDAVP